MSAFHGVVTEHWYQHGFGFFAVESTEPGTTGTLWALSVSRARASYLLWPIAPNLGWRLGRQARDRGLATEAAVAVLDFAFRRLAFDEVIAIVHPANTRSQRVPQKLGMDIEQQVKNPPGPSARQGSRRPAVQAQRYGVCWFWW